MLVCTTHLWKMWNLYITYENPTAQVTVLSGFSPFLESITMITLWQSALVRKKPHVALPVNTWDSAVYADLYPVQFASRQTPNINLE